MLVPQNQALCCLMTAVTNITAAAGAPEFTHKYTSTALTWPYCGDHSLVGRSLGPSPIPPPASFQLLPHEDPQTDREITYHRFELDLVRCGPPFPEDPSTCLGDLYGSCTDEPWADTLSGHQRGLSEEADRIQAQLIPEWCLCLTASAPVLFPASNPLWMEELSILQPEGRYAAVRVKVGALLM